MICGVTKGSSWVGGLEAWGKVRRGNGLGEQREASAHLQLRLAGVAGSDLAAVQPPSGMVRVLSDFLVGLWSVSGQTMGVTEVRPRAWVVGIGQWEWEAGIEADGTK